MSAQLIAFPSERVSSNFDDAWAILPQTMRTRSFSRDKLRPLWASHAKKIGGFDVLLSRLKAYLAGDKDLPRSGGPGLQKWLSDQRYDHWGDDASCSLFAVSEETQRVKFENAEIRAKIVLALGEAFVRSYIDQCGLLDEGSGPILLVKSSTAASRLREKGQELKALGLYGIRLKPVG